MAFNKPSHNTNELPLGYYPAKQKESESFQGICLNVGRSTPPEGLSWQSPDVLELGGKR